MAMDTSLSPRLRHLLIQEDKRTGRLIMPFESSSAPTITVGSLSPPISPTFLHGGPSPVDSLPPTAKLPPSVASSELAGAFLPRFSLSLPRPTGDRRASGSILSLLNELNVQSPPSSASSDQSSFRLEQERMDRDRNKERERERDRERQSQAEMDHEYDAMRRSSSGSTSAVSSVGIPGSSAVTLSHSISSSTSGSSSTPRPPSAATIPSAISASLASVHQPPFFAESRRSVTLTQAPYPLRPDMLRRHSSHPYEYNPASRPIPTGYIAAPYPAAVPVIGARAPISRTTKACNACRARKVRCDAGGLGNGETGPCSRCREAGVECVYTGVQKKRGPCPGTARPSISKTRRQSAQRTSIVSACLTTPPDEFDYGTAWRPTPPYYSYDGQAVLTSLPPRDVKGPIPHSSHPHSHPHPSTSMHTHHSHVRSHPPHPEPVGHASLPHMENRYTVNPNSKSTSDIRSWEPNHHSHPHSRVPSGPLPHPRHQYVSGWEPIERGWQEHERDQEAERSREIYSRGQSSPERERDLRSVFAKDYSMRSYSDANSSGPSSSNNRAHSFTPASSVAPSRRLSQNPHPFSAPGHHLQHPHPSYRHTMPHSPGPPSASSPIPRSHGPSPPTQVVGPERKPSSGKDMNSLPPLRVAIRRSDSYYEP